jgi:hypothetical protein
MKDRILLSIVLLFVVAFAAQFALGADNGMIPAEEKVIDLPDDSGKWYVTVMGDPKDAEYQKLVKWFDSHRGLKSLKAKTHFHAIKSDSTMYKERYADEVKGLPTVRIQDDEGRVAFERWADNVPWSHHALYEAIAGDIQTAQKERRCNPFRPCRPQPEKPAAPCPCPPEEEPLDPEPGPVGPAEPLIFPVPEPTRGGPISGPITALALILSALAGSGAGGFKQYRLKGED